MKIFFLVFKSEFFSRKFIPGSLKMFFEFLISLLLFSAKGKIGCKFLVPIFGQEPCEGSCYSEEEVLNIANTIKENESEIDSLKSIISI